MDAEETLNVDVRSIKSPFRPELIDMSAPCAGDRYKMQVIGDSLGFYDFAQLCRLHHWLLSTEHHSDWSS